MFKKMDHLVEFENCLFNNEPLVYKFDIADIDFLVDRLVLFPCLRPLCLEKAISISSDFCQNNKFRQILLEKSVQICPVLIFRLSKLGYYCINDVYQYLDQPPFVLSYYFRKDIDNSELFKVEKWETTVFEDYFVPSESEIDSIIDYGFLPNTFEYCLKYDDIIVFKEIFRNDGKKAKWSPFEWSRKPKSLDLLSFSGFFGSLQCFKFLLINGFQINDDIRSNVICSGNYDIYYICNQVNTEIYMQTCLASEFCRLDMLEFLISKDALLVNKNNNFLLHIASENGHLSIVHYLVTHGADVDKKEPNDMSYCFEILLFI